MLTTPETFLEKTCLILDYHVEVVLAEQPHTLTPEQVAWFFAHCDIRFRYFHANDSYWRKWLEDRNPKIDPRLQCKVWIRHWLAAYTLDPTTYQERHVCCPACGSPNIFYYHHHGTPRWDCDDCGYKSEAEKSITMT
jgi:ribosomal protein S27AE